MAKGNQEGSERAQARSNVRVVDVSEDLQPGMFPCCPICDSEIEVWEEVVIVHAHGSAALAHMQCVER